MKDAKLLYDKMMSKKTKNERIIFIDDIITAATSFGGDIIKDVIPQAIQNMERQAFIDKAATTAIQGTLANPQLKELTITWHIKTAYVYAEALWEERQRRIEK
jgi:hypothetical protein